MITAENYFSPGNELKYIGSSQFKSFQACESAALAKIQGHYKEEKSTALLVGSYVDAHFSNELDLFKAQNPEIFTRQGSLKSEYQQADQIIQRIERDEMMMKYLSGKPQVIMTGEIEGVPVKIKIDSYHEGKVIGDLKVMKDMKDVYKDGSYQEFWEAWGYAIQGAIYREVVRQNTGIIIPFVLIVATKEKPEPNIDILKIADSRLDYELSVVKDNIERFNDIKKGLIEPERCGECAYCRSTKILDRIREVG
jgi:hypothetical protein